MIDKIGVFSSTGPQRPPFFQTAVRTHQGAPETAGFFTSPGITTLLLPVALLLLAFSLRLFALDARPLWWDEGITLTFSRLLPADNAAFAVLTEDVNPPFYRWSVGGLTALVGTNVFTTRMVNVFTGLLAAAAVFALAKRLFWRRVALWTLLLFAISPMQIYYAQEAKGYTFMTAAILIGGLFWYRLHRWALAKPPEAVQTGSPAVWLGYGLTVALGLGANYLAIFVIVLENIFTLVITLRARRAGMLIRSLSGHWVRWLVVQVVGALPILFFALATAGGTSSGLASTSGDQVRLTFDLYIWRFFREFVAGPLLVEQYGSWLMLLLMLLVVAGLFTGLNRTYRRSWWATFIWLALPLLLGFFFHVTYPWFFPRFLLFAQPALLTLAGVGLASLPRILARVLDRDSRSWVARLSWTPGLLVLLLTRPLLAGQYDAPPRFDEDEIWPILFTDLRQIACPEDVVIARLPWMPGYMYAYLPPTRLPDWVLGFYDASTIDDEMTLLLDKYDRIWEIDYITDPFQAPADTINSLQGRAALVHSRKIDPGTLSLLISARSLASGRNSPPVIDEFVNGVRVEWRPVNYSAGPGDIVGINLAWSTEVPLDAHLVRFLHLMAPDGRLVAQVDREPAMGLSMSFEWTPGERIADPVALVVPPGLPSGEYALWVGIYDRDTLDRIPLASGQDHLDVGPVVIP